MSFNKRYINIENILRVYKDSEMNGLVKYITKPDALIISTKDNSRYIINAINKGDLFGAKLIIKYELQNYRY